MSDFLSQAQALFDYTQGLRRDIHRHPEMGYMEVRTASIVAGELKALGMEVVSGIAETGVVGLLDGQGDGPVILLRFEMDALPILEENVCEYASLNPGVMHACGHDAHVAVGLTVARLLSARKGEMKGTVKFVFQPAEEGMGGAGRMIDEGILDNPRPQAALALHVWNEKPVGWIGVPTGPMMAGGERFYIRLRGRGGHGALPHQTVDPVAAAAYVITALQTVVARNVSPLQPAVVSVTALRAGEVFNVISPEAELQGTIRTFEPETRAVVLERFRQVVDGVGQAMGCQVDIQLEQLTPAVINDPEISARVQAAVNRTLPGREITTDWRTMVSEDIACIMKEIPGCYFMIGSANSALGKDFGHHHPRFDIDESILPEAVALMAAAAWEFVGSI